jgi:hypothetical protein
LNMTSRVIPMPRSGKLTLKAISDRKFGNLTMIGNQWGYYVRATREWRIMRRGEPMGVWLFHL